MPRRNSFDSADVILLANRQDSLVTLAQLEELGMCVGSALKRSRVGGPWQRVLPGILSLHNGPLTFRQQLAAALMYAGPDGMLTGAAALAVRGFRRRPPTPPVQVLVPDQRQRTSSSFVVVERTVRLPTAEEIAGLAVAPAARAVFDASRRQRLPDDVRALAAEALQRNFTTVPDLAEELRNGQIRGSRLLRNAVSEVAAGVRSVAEGDARNLVASSPRLSKMWWNPRISDSSGAFLFCPDGWLDEIGLAWQIDSLEFHLSPAAYARTLRLHAAATAAGIIVVHHLPSDLRRRPAEVREELEAAADLAAQRPRPNVYAQRINVNVA